MRGASFPRAEALRRTFRAVGIDLNSLPLKNVNTGFGQPRVPTADINLALFPDSLFPKFDLEVGILSTALDPLGLDFLGADLLNQFSYWEMSPSADGLSGTFYAAVPEPPMSLTLARTLPAFKSKS